MAKSADAFRTISEVAEWLDTPAHVLRFWESRFSQVKPVKRAGGRRYYRPGDMLLLGGIKKLLHEDGMTIKGVQKLLRTDGVKHISTLSQTLDPADAATLDAEVIDMEPLDTITAQQAPQDTPTDTIDDAPEALAALPDPISEATPPLSVVPPSEPEQPALENTPEPVLEAEPEPVLEAEPEPVLEAEPEPVLEAEPEPIEITTPDPAPTLEAATQIEPTLDLPEPDTEPTLDLPEPDAHPEEPREPEQPLKTETPVSIKAPEPNQSSDIAAELDLPETDLPQADIAEPDAPKTEAQATTEVEPTQLSSIFSRLNSLHDRIKADINSKPQD